MRREHRERAARDRGGWLLAHAILLIIDAARALTDASVWTKKSRAARRASTKKPGDKSCSPHDSRARKWTAIGMIELGAVDVREEVLALELLRRAGRDWPIQRVEDARGRTAVLWTMALAVSAPGQKLAARGSCREDLKSG